MPRDITARSRQDALNRKAFVFFFTCSCTVCLVRKNTSMLKSEAILAMLHSEIKCLHPKSVDATALN